MNHLLKRTAAIIAALLMLFLLLQGMVKNTAVLANTQNSDSFEPSNIQFFRQTAQTGKLETANMSIFGPQICTAYGDPFSPWNSPYAPDSYTHQFQIHIPADYAYDTVRVELFDPDSINNDENFATVARTQHVQDPNIVNPILPATTTKACGIDSESGTQDDTCVLPTDELNYLNNPLPMEQINPYWFMRIDENRGQGDPAAHGNGACGGTGSYETGFNTQTRFELYYYRADGNQPIRQDLASYTGQTSDARDLATGATTPGDHNTDLFWVSPGAEEQGPDFDALYGTNAVPVDPGSNATFELNIADGGDLAEIVVDKETGERIVHLDITSLSGASENGFAVWAGPPIYVDAVPANVNQRNIAVVNTDGVHDSGGVKITAVQNLVINNIFNEQYAHPLLELPAIMSGQTISMTHFDIDAGAQPPMVFYFDTIPESEWSRTFTDGCPPGFCNNQWAEPAIQLKIPGDAEGYASDTPAYGDCVPFDGGTLMMRITGGRNDTFALRVQQQPAPLPTPTPTPTSTPAPTPEPIDNLLYLPYLSRPE